MTRLQIDRGRIVLFLMSRGGLSHSLAQAIVRGDHREVVSVYDGETAAMLLAGGLNDVMPGHLDLEGLRPEPHVQAADVVGRGE